MQADGILNGFQCNSGEARERRLREWDTTRPSYACFCVDEGPVWRALAPIDLKVGRFRVPPKRVFRSNY